MSHPDRATDRAGAGDIVRLGTMDDQTVDALLAGQPVDERHARVAVVVETIRAVRTSPAPAPSADLSALFEAAAPERRSPGRRRRALRVAGGAGLVTKLAFGAGAAAAVGGASVTGVMPQPVAHVVHEIVEGVTPSHDDGPREPSPTRPPAAPEEGSASEPPAPATTASTPPGGSVHEVDAAPGDGTTSTAVDDPTRGKPAGTPGTPPDHAGPADDPGPGNANANADPNPNPNPNPQGDPDANANGNGNGNANANANANARGNGPAR